MKGTKNNKNAFVKGAGQTKPSKQKVLLPTLKEQQRYVVYSVLAKGKPEFKGLFDANMHNSIVSQCNGMLGIFDGAKAGLMGMKYDADRMRGIIRVDNKYVDKLKVCIGLIKDINGIPVSIDCIYVSGMINKAMDAMTR